MSSGRDGRIDKTLRRLERMAGSGRRFLPIVGPEKGEFYYLAAKSAKAKSVLELGTLIGYSSLLFSKAVGAGGTVLTVERDKGFAREAEGNFRSAGVTNVRVLNSDARDAVKSLCGKGRKFDLIMLDIEKDEYNEVFDGCVCMLRKNGIILTDNVLWDTKEVKSFRKMLKGNRDVESVIIPIKDGIAMSVKR